MSQRHREPSSASSESESSIRPESTPERAPALDPELAALLAHGNHAIGERVPASDPGPADLATRAALALRVPPRDPGWSERLIGHVERSDLAPERKEAVISRLRWDQVVADDVARAVSAAFGADTDEIRAPAMAALDGAVGVEVPELLAAKVSERTGVDEGRAVAFVRALGLVKPWWEEDEEDAPPGDYLAEATGT